MQCTRPFIQPEECSGPVGTDVAPFATETELLRTPAAGNIGGDYFGEQIRLLHSTIIVEYYQVYPWISRTSARDAKGCSKRRGSSSKPCSASHETQQTHPTHISSQHERVVHNKCWPCVYYSCAYTCSKKADVFRHVVSVHEKQRSFLCSVEGCARSFPGEGFSRKDALKRHLDTVTHRF